MNKLRKLVVFSVLALVAVSSFCDAPDVRNVRASQRSGSTVVDIFYDVYDSDGDRLDVWVTVIDGEMAVSTTNFTGDVGSIVVPGKSKHIVWDAGTDYNEKFSESMSILVTAVDSMVRIPGGTNCGENPLAAGESYESRYPQYYTNTVDTFYMDATEVTKAQWDAVYSWAVTHSYSFDNVGSGSGLNHPVYYVNWYDCVKWCNARSEKDGRTPCYTVSGSVYRTGQSSPYCNFSANGYRLPTSDEWEYAARGGLSGKRFPWGDTITHSQANYCSYWSSGIPYYPYDLSATSGFHPDYDDGWWPFTSPVNTFAVNGYGLYDMAGNVYEWCNDASGSCRCFRGGSWTDHAYYLRCGFDDWYYPFYGDYGIGFRSVCR